LRPIDPRNIFYNDLDEETAQSWVSKLKVHSWPTLASPLSYAAWQHVPSAYLLCEADQAIPIQAQEGMVAASGMVSERCSASHSPFLSQPEVTASFIRRQAGEAV
jgi:Alpha/beta hydrolase family